jgi:hypothetical protein
MVSLYANMAPGRVETLANEVLDDVRAANDPLLLGDTLYSLATALRLLGRTAESRALAAEVAELVTALPATRLTLASRALSAYIAIDDDPEHGRALLLDGARLAHSIGCNGWANLALAETVGYPEGDSTGVERGREVLQGIRSNHMFRLGATNIATYQLAGALAVRGEAGDLDAAYELVRGLEKISGRIIGGRFLGVLATLAWADGRREDAARIYGVQSAGLKLSGINFVGSQRNMARGRERLLEHFSETELERYMAEGARLTPDQAYVLAMNLG